MAGCESAALIGPLGPNSKIQRHNARKASESAGKSVPIPCSTSAASIAVAGGAGDKLSVFAVESSFVSVRLTFRWQCMQKQLQLWQKDVLEESWHKLKVAAAPCRQVQRFPEWPARSCPARNQLATVLAFLESSGRRAIRSNRLVHSTHNFIYFYYSNKKVSLNYFFITMLCQQHLY